MNVRELQRPIKRVPRTVVETAKLDKYIDSHEESLLSLLVEKHPDRSLLLLVKKHPTRVREFCQRLTESIKVAA